MKLVISDAKTGKAYNKKTEEPVFLNKKLGDEVDLAPAGLPGFKARIAGGSDKQGFPMKPTMQGQGRKKILVRKGIGVKQKRKGLSVRKSMRGSLVAKDIAQLNLVITKQGSEPISKLITPEAKKEEEKETAKERMVRKSLKSVGDTALAEEAKKIKGKVRK